MSKLSKRNKIPDFEWSTLTSISPSQFVALQKCAFQHVLRSSLKAPLLPIPPAAYLGKVIHKILELIAIGQIREESEFQKQWQYLIHQQEELLQLSNLEQYIPLADNVNYFALKKWKIQQYFLTKKSASKSKYKATSEKWLQSKDGKINGKIDLILENKEVKLIDFKTGEILDKDTGKIKEPYEVQLKLYAYLYKENKQKYPNSLWLVDLKRQWYEVVFSQEECENLAAQAKEMLKRINHLVLQEDIENLAIPHTSICSNCSYRPACPFYWGLPKSDDAFIVDLKGTISSIHQFKNGDFNLEIEQKGTRYLILKIDKKHFEILNVALMQNLQIFNLGNTKNKTSFRFLKNTAFFL